MMCRELTPGYFGEICGTDLLLADVEERIGGTLLELALLPEPEYLAAIRSHPLEFMSLLGDAEMAGQISMEGALEVIAELPKDIENTLLEAASFMQAQGFGASFTAPSVH